MPLNCSQSPPLPLLAGIIYVHVCKLLTLMTVHPENLTVQRDHHTVHFGDLYQMCGLEGCLLHGRISHALNQIFLEQIDICCV